MSCDEEYKNIILPTFYNDLQGSNSAEEMCNKLEMYSILKHFETPGQWQKFHEKFKDRDAVINECWVGGRKLFWIPYADRDGDFSFHHVLTGEKTPDVWFPGNKP